MKDVVKGNQQKTSLTVCNVLDTCYSIHNVYLLASDVDNGMRRRNVKGVGHFYGIVSNFLNNNYDSILNLRKNKKDNVIHDKRIVQGLMLRIITSVAYVMATNDVKGIPSI